MQAPEELRPVKGPIGLEFRHLSGQQRGGRQRFVGSPLQLTIGRSPACELALGGPLSGGVSQRHALVSIEKGEAWIQDGNSLNGTFLNGVRISRARLEEGACIGLGRHGPRLGVRILEAPLLEPAQSGTSDQPRPSPAHSGRGHARRIAAVVALGLLVGAAAIATSTLLNTPGSHPAGAGTVTRSPSAPAAASTPPPSAQPRIDAAPAQPSGQPTDRSGDRDPSRWALQTPGAVLIRAAIPTSGGIIHRELGEGVLVDERRVLTVTEVLDGIDRWQIRTAQGALAHLEVLALARPTAPIAIESAAVEGGFGPARLAILGLAASASVPHPELGAPSGPLPATLSHPTWAGPAEALPVRNRLGSDGNFATTAASAGLLKLRLLPSAPGRPLYDAKGRLMGLTIGPQRPDLALSGASLQRFLSSPLRPRLKPL